MMKRPKLVSRKRGSSVGSVMVDFNFNNLKQHLQEFVKKSLQHRQKVWYRVPEVRQFWDDEQEEFESDWAELFFDLIYVAMAFKLGEVIKNEVTRDDFHFGTLLMFFIGQFLPMYDAWYRRSNYLARFVSDSLLHKGVDIVENILVSFMALFIGTRDQINQGVLVSAPRSSSDHHAENTTDFQEELDHILSRSLAESTESEVKLNIFFGFCLAKLIFAIVYIFKYLELRHFTSLDKTPKQRTGVKNMTSYSLKQQFTNVVFSAGAATCAYIGQVETAFGLLIFSYIFVNFVMSYLFVTRNSKEPGVPFNVYYIIKRFGEFTMLMLGEGVLQIIILPISETDVFSHLGTFFLAYLILNSLEFLKFFMVPDTPEEHVLTRSSWRSPFVLLIYPFFFGSLICVGVGLKLVVGEADNLEEDEELHQRIRGLLAYALMFSMAALITKNILHLGLYDIFFRTDFNRDKVAKRSIYHISSECSKDENLRTERIVFTFSFLSCSALFLILLAVDVNARTLLGIAFVFLIFIFMMNVVEKRIFKDFEVNRGRSTSAEQELDYLLQPVYETELFNMNDLWRKANPEVGDEDPETIEAKAEFEEEIERRKEQLNHMLSYMRAHSNALQEKINRTHCNQSSLEKAKRFLGEVKELRELTELIEENLYFLFSQHMQDLHPPIARANTRSKGGFGVFGRGTPAFSTKYSSFNPQNIAQIETMFSRDEEDDINSVGPEDDKKEPVMTTDDKDKDSVEEETKVDIKKDIPDEDKDEDDL